MSAAVVAQPRTTRWSSIGLTSLVTVFVLALGYLVLWPLLKLQLLAFEDGASAYRVAFGRDNTREVILVTVALAIGSTLIAMVLGTLLAFATSRLPSRVSALRILPVLPIVFPPVAIVVGWAFLLSPGPGYLNAVLRHLPWWSHLDSGPANIYTVPWIILLTGFGLTSFVYLFVSAGIANIGSSHLEAAQVCGSSSLGVFFRIVLPLLRPALVYSAGVAFLLGLGQFTAPLLLGTSNGVSVLTTEMYRSVSESPINFGVAAAFGSPLLLVGIAVVVVQRLILGDQARFVTHGGKGFAPGGKPSWLAALFVTGYGVVAIMLPFLGLLAVALSPYWSATIDTSSMTLEHFRDVFRDPNVLSAVTTSIITGLSAVAIVIPVGYLLAVLLLRGRRFRALRVIADFLVALPLGVPAVVFGGGFLLAYTAPPLVLYGTKAVLILVYVTLMLPFATRMVLTGMVSLGSAYTEASRVSGASEFTTNLRIIVPLLRPTIFAAIALIFILLSHEFAASLLVRSATTQVMGTVVVDLWRNGQYPLVAAASLVLTAITAAGVAIAMLFGGRNILDKI